MGVCPQHDVLFDNLTVREHILFFSQLKGCSYTQADCEAKAFVDMFHLEKRTDHLGSELSGGQQRLNPNLTKFNPNLSQLNPKLITLGSCQLQSQSVAVTQTCHN
jgi:ABC-type polar amino acid transport system ATPase subunit